MKMPNMCPFEKKEKEVFFRLTTFFFRNKIFFFNKQLLFIFLCIIKQKKISERSETKNFEKFLTIFRKNFQKNFCRIALKFFFALQYIKNWTKVVPWKKFFCSWKKNFVSLKKITYEILWSEVWKVGF